MPPLLAAGSRFLTAGALLAVILAVRGKSLRISRRELGASAIAGGLLLGLGVGLVHVAETRIDSSVAAMIAGTVPLQIIAMRLAVGESPARATRPSTLAGLLGLGLVVAPGLGAGSTAVGLAVMVSATMFWSTGSFLSRRLALPRDPSSRLRTRWHSGRVPGDRLRRARRMGRAERHDVRARLGPGVGLPRRHGLADRLHGVRLAPARCANLARRDAPVREPARRDRARNAVPGRAPQPVVARGGRSSSAPCTSRPA